MSKQKLLLVDTLCTTYEIDRSFINELKAMGLIEIQTLEQENYIHTDVLSELEKMIRLHQDLHVNIEGIDVILNLLQKMELLQNEVTALRNKLDVYES